MIKVALAFMLLWAVVLGAMILVNKFWNVDWKTKKSVLKCLTISFVSATIVSVVLFLIVQLF